jgi:hypothetical protein
MNFENGPADQKMPSAVGTGIMPRSANPDANVRDAMHRLTVKSVAPPPPNRFGAQPAAGGRVYSDRVPMAQNPSEKSKSKKVRGRGQATEQRATPCVGAITSQPILGCLHHHYCRI